MKRFRLKKSFIYACPRCRPRLDNGGLQKAIKKTADITLSHATEMEKQKQLFEEQQKELLERLKQKDDELQNAKREIKVNKEPPPQQSTSKSANERTVSIPDRTYKCTSCKELSQNIEEIPVPTKIRFYSNSLSGIKSKLQHINHQLTREIFDVTFIQETWMNESVTDDELLSNTNYQIVRHDRSQFNSRLKNGRGILTLIHNAVKYAEIQLNIKTTIELQIIELYFGQNHFITVNLYMPQARARNLQTNEFKRVLQKIKNDFPTHHLIVIGDFNIPTAKWEINSITSDLQISNFSELTPLEKRFFDIMASYGLVQQNYVSNSRGSFLDLVFSTITLNNIEAAPPHCQIHNNSAYHTATTFEYTYHEITNHNKKQP